jgi:NAD-dependent deacetylase
MMRPSVVLFGELLPAAATAQFEVELSRGFDVVFAVGTTAGFPYIFEPVAEAGRRGITTIEINPDETPLSEFVTYRFASGARSTLQSILAEVRATVRSSSN